MEPRLSDREACSPGHQQEIQARGSEGGSGEGTAEESPQRGAWRMKRITSGLPTTRKVADQLTQSRFSGPGQPLVRGPPHG